MHTVGFQYTIVDNVSCGMYIVIFHPTGSFCLTSSEQVSPCALHLFDRGLEPRNDCGGARYSFRLGPCSPPRLQPTPQCLGMTWRIYLSPQPSDLHCFNPLLSLDRRSEITFIMPPLAGFWHSLLARHASAVKAALKEASRAIEAKVANKVQPQLEPALARNTPKQPLHPVARLKQRQTRLYSTKRSFITTVRHFTAGVIHEAAPIVRVNRTAFPKSNVGNAVNRSSGRAPFASTLRPNLTGGALGRTAGGYTVGSGRVGGARYFSHGPAAQAQVVQNVSQAVRAFFISGQKAQFHGINPATGEKRYKAVSTLQEETGRKMRDLPRATPGSHIAFSVNPTITALTPLSHVAGYNTAESTNLNTEGLLDVLSTDFSRSLKELAMVLNDLKRVSELGDLPITYQDSCLCIHFPGCDAETVERLCEELGIQRGIVVQDEDFDAFTGTEMALLFPFAPSSSQSEASDLFDATPAKQTVEIDWRNMLSPSEKSVRSSVSELDLEEEDNPWAFDADHSSPSGYESLHYESSDSAKHDPLEYQGFEGIYRFIEQCDAARR